VPCHIRATLSLPIPYRAAIDLVDQHAEPSSGTVKFSNFDGVH
jgi:hypothetical protein